MSSLTSLLVAHPVLVSGSLQSAYIYISKTKQRRKVWKDQGWKKHDDQELLK